MKPEERDAGGNFSSAKQTVDKQFSLPLEFLPQYFFHFNFPPPTEGICFDVNICSLGFTVMIVPSLTVSS